MYIYTYIHTCIYAYLYVYIYMYVYIYIGDTRDAGSIPGSGRSPGEWNGNLFQYSCLEYSMDRRAWWATVHGVRVRHDWLCKQTHTQISISMHIDIYVYILLKVYIYLYIYGFFLNLIKAIYENPTANFTLNGEKLKVFLLRSGIWQWCQLLPLLFNTVLGVSSEQLARKRKKNHLNWKEVKLPLFSDDMISYIGNLQDSTNIRINESKKLKDTKISIQISVVFLYTNKEWYVKTDHLCWWFMYSLWNKFQSLHVFN